MGQLKNAIGNIKEKERAYLKKISDKEFRGKIISAVNPELSEGSDYVVGYIVRVFIFLLPLLIYEESAFMGISLRDILFGTAILFMAIYCGVKELKNKKEGAILFGKKELLLFICFFALLICFIVQVIGFDSELKRTYLYIECFLVIFVVTSSLRADKYFLRILSASNAILFISMYRYIFTGKATLLLTEKILGNTAWLMPIIMLGSLVYAILYLVEEDERYKNFYLLFTGASFVILFLYGNMAAFMIMLIFIMGLQFLGKPTEECMKKNTILLFLFAFCASNAPLLTYFNAKGIKKQFDLEYSIYIDLIIAVAFFFVIPYWEKLSKEQDPKTMLIEGFAKWYKRSFIVVLSVIVFGITIGRRMENAPKVNGGKAVAGYSWALWNAVNDAKGEMLHIFSVYGLIGLAISLLFGIFFIIRTFDVLKNDDIDEVSKGYVLIATLFVILCAFYPFPYGYTVIYMVFIGLSLSIGNEYAFVEEVEGMSLQENQNEAGNRSTIGVGIAEFFRKYALQLGFVFVSGFAAVLLMLAIFVVQRLFVPAREYANGTNSLISDLYEEDAELYDFDEELQDNDEVITDDEE
ncbi:hypothetical protein [Butyrivibrio sp. VCD2006]|uniref:hypothetical protein n=1 Tax=Butyrivibrio sp. VCD2006 TaxID=1280664 RepID=UPI0003FBA750|nr:hypothetical protein [Butyrivibrio sp. VCD2006]